jgi:hypothetical protein
MFILFQPSLPTGVTTIAISTVPPAAHTMSQPAHLLLQPVNQLIPAMFASQSLCQPISPQICAMPQFVQSIGRGTVEMAIVVTPVGKLG